MCGCISKPCIIQLMCVVCVCVVGCAISTVLLDNIVSVFNGCAILTISGILQKTDKTPTECTHILACVPVAQWIRALR